MAQQVGTTADCALSAFRVSSSSLSFSHAKTISTTVSSSLTKDLSIKSAASGSGSNDDAPLLNRRSVANFQLAHGATPRTLDIGSWSLPGNRYAGLNQDYMVCQELYTNGEIPKDGQQAYVVAICDGHGILGDKSACFAGKALARHLYCSTTIRNKVLAKLPTSLLQEEMRSAFHKAHNAACLVYDMPPKTVQYPACTGAQRVAEFSLVDVNGMKLYRSAKGVEKMLECGTTCTAALIQGRRVCLANVGDSSAVVGRELRDEQGAITLSTEVVSVRHHALLDSEAQRIQSQYGSNTQILPDGYIKVLDGPWEGYELSVTRALGHKHMEHHGVTYEPDCVLPDMDNAHCCLVLGSDGVWDVLTPEQAVQHVMEGRRQGKTAAQVARTLVEWAVQEGMTPPELSSKYAGEVDDMCEQDNTSAIVVFFGSPLLDSPAV